MKGTLYRFLLGLVVVLVVLACDAAEPNAQGTLPKPQSVAKTSLEKEAEQAAMAFLESKVRKCGEDYFVDSHFEDGNDTVTQFKNLGWKIDGWIVAGAQTEAERLNAQNNPGDRHEWRGFVTLSCTSMRHTILFKDPKYHPVWEQWRDCKLYINTPGLNTHQNVEFFMHKKNGKWEVDPRDLSRAVQPTKIPVDCNALPKE